MVAGSGPVPSFKARGHPMRSLFLSACVIVLIATSAKAEIICTDHGGCRETGKKIILGNGGGVTSQQELTSYRDGKPKRVKVRPVYTNE
jgi:hypothetical protein